MWIHTKTQINVKWLNPSKWSTNPCSNAHFSLCLFSTDLKVNMVGLRFTLALALLLLGSTPSCLGQDEGQDPGPPGQGPEGPPPDSARSANLDGFLRSREGSLHEREEEILEERAYGKNTWQTRMGKKCEKGSGVYGYNGCNTYPGSTAANEYLWCYTQGSTEWESCCSWSCTYYEPSWGSPYYYCYINSEGSVWDYCDPDTYAG